MQKLSSLISIVIPTHNMARLLPEALQSVFSNSYRDIEIIIIDDGSTDGTAEVVEEFKQRTNIPITCHRSTHRVKSACINAVFANVEVTGDLWVIQARRS